MTPPRCASSKVGPDAVLWDLIAAGASRSEDRVLLRAVTPDRPFFVDNGLVGSHVSQDYPLADRSRFLVHGCYDDAWVAPVLRRGNGVSGTAALLWVKLEDGKAAKALFAFPHGPTLLLREGGSVRRFAVWALDRALGLDWIERANKRLAYRLGCKQKWAMPEAMWLPVPGSVLREGRASRPLLVRAEVCAVDRVYTARELVGGLKDPPEPKDWRAAA